MPAGQSRKSPGEGQAKRFGAQSPALLNTATFFWGFTKTTFSGIFVAEVLGQAGLQSNTGVIFQLAMVHSISMLLIENHLDLPTTRAFQPISFQQTRRLVCFILFHSDSVRPVLKSSRSHAVQKEFSPDCLIILISSPDCFADFNG